MNIAGVFVGSMEGAATVRIIPFNTNFKICIKPNIYSRERKIEKLCVITVVEFCSIVFHCSLFVAELTQN